MSAENATLPGTGELPPWDISYWEPRHYVMWFVGICLASELMAYLVLKTSVFHPLLIPARGKHLDSLGKLDIAFILFNKATTPVFMYHLIHTCWRLKASGHAKWDLGELNVFNTAGSLVLLFAVYDLFYCFFHRALHLRSVYKYVHKHHHQQKAPSRGNLDAVNVHPFEFVVGEWNHIFALWLVPHHIVTAVVFMVIGGVLASLNHTRYDFVFGPFYSVRVHDVHHRLPESNYSQYTMLWDRVFNTYRPYEEKQQAAKSE